ncbi:uncharacterized protein [Argopecten irradians]|uniref:uncharacterized protein n=1 Tax=Argopecten irradians TaxID=31199 RepID=UPI003711C657
MAEEGRSNRNGLPMFHLRRIGPPATRPRVADIMDFYEVTTMIGKSPQSTYIIDSASDMRRKYISRNHARVVIRTPSNDHRLFDDSMNGVFVNNLKILHNVTLTEGDRVTFGHPRGAEIPGGMRKLQPDSEYQFLFERCNCPGQMIVSHRPSCDRPFVIPDVPVQAAKSKSKKRDRNATTMLTTEDVLKLKEGYEQKSPCPPSVLSSQSSSNNDMESQQDYSALESTTTQPSNQDSSASGERAAEHRVQININSHNCDRDASYKPTVTETPCVSSELIHTETRPAVTETPCVSSEQMDTETRPAVTETPCVSSEQMDTETRPAVTETPCVSSELIHTETRPA